MARWWVNRNENFELTENFDLGQRKKQKNKGKKKFDCSRVMTTEWGGETSRLWRVWRTVHQMVLDRVYLSQRQV
jgi:hypothetical protein